MPIPETIAEPAVIQEPETTPESAAAVMTLPALPEAEVTTESAGFSTDRTAAFESGEINTVKYIGIDTALEDALSHAGIEKEDAKVKGVFRTRDEDGKAVYEVSFEAGEISYDYVLDALSGEIDGWKMSGFTASNTAAFGADAPDAADAGEKEADREMIGEERARELAYEDAAVKSADVLRVKVELQEDESRYRIEFRTADGQFESFVDAYSGEILEAPQK
jgi:Peptidase propeptide and YPEB domain.